MKKSPNGFVTPLLLAIVAIVLIGGGAYLYMQSKHSTSPMAVSPTINQGTATSTQNESNGFTATPVSGSAPLDVTFTVPASFYCLDGDLSCADHDPSFTIDYGDGTRGTGGAAYGKSALHHTYSTAGNYYATLTDNTDGMGTGGPYPVIGTTTIIVKPTQSTATSTMTSDWKTFRSEKDGIEFSYPANLNADGDSYGSTFVQLQMMEDGAVSSVAGGVSIYNKPIPTSDWGSSYVKMYASKTQCPTSAGEIQQGTDDEQYCFTGKTISANAGLWKEVYNCSPTTLYMNKGDASSCPLEYWLDTPQSFVTVTFNYFAGSPAKGSEEEQFFEKFLKSFIISTPEK